MFMYTVSVLEIFRLIDKIKKRQMEKYLSYEEFQFFFSQYILGVSLRIFKVIICESFTAPACQILKTHTSKNAAKNKWGFKMANQT